jgi:hypothetical protein
MVAGVRFVESRIGARIAYTTSGSGPPLIVIPPWISHLEAVTAMSGYRHLDLGVQRFAVLGPSHAGPVLLNAYAKLGVRGRTEAIAQWLRPGSA